MLTLRKMFSASLLPSASQRHASRAPWPFKATRHFWNLTESAPRTTRILALRRIGEMEILTGPHAGTGLENLSQLTVGGSGIGARFQDDERTGPEVRSDSPSRIQNVGKVGSRPLVSGVGTHMITAATSRTSPKSVEVLNLPAATISPMEFSEMCLICSYPH